MGDIKYVENNKLNQKVSQIIEELKEELISQFRPRSIIIAGSFGKGEACVLEDEEGRLRFLSDCEVILISERLIFKRKKIKKFCEHFYNKTGLKVDISGRILSLQLLMPSPKNFKPTIDLYDQKYGSRVVYGKDYFKRVPDFKPEEIPVWEGIRLLFNRMAGALENFSFQNPSAEMIFWADKVVLACQDSLLLLKGKYHPLYRERNNIFSELFPKYFNDFNEKEKLLILAKEATERKLGRRVNTREPIKYWFDVQKICDKTFRYIIKKDLQIDFSDYLEFQEKYMKCSKLKEYTRLPFTNFIIQNIYLILKDIIFNKSLTPIGLLYNFSVYWRHLIYSTIPLVYFGILGKKVINEQYLNQAAKLVSLYRRKNYNNLFESWEEVKKQILKYWHRFC